MNKVLCIVLLAMVAAFAYYAATAEDRQVADVQAMRAYVVSQLTDEEIKQLRLEAKNEVSKREAAYKKDQEEYWQKRSEQHSKCEDFVYKTRNEEMCRGSFSDVLMLKEHSFDSTTENEIFENLLLGVCKYEISVAAAKKLGCLK